MYRAFGDELSKQHSAMELLSIQSSKPDNTHMLPRLINTPAVTLLKPLRLYAGHTFSIEIEKMHHIPKVHRVVLCDLEEPLNGTPRLCYPATRQTP